jgi:hypothetical protein
MAQITGLGNPRTVRALKKLISHHSPDLLFIMETKLLDSNFSFITNSFDMYNVNSINCSTSGGGKAGVLLYFGTIVLL